MRLLEEIQVAGYRGDYTQLKEFGRRVRSRAEREPIVRFETEPGLQAQVDFAEVRFPWGKRYVLLVVPATRASCGCASSPGRTWRRSSPVWRKPAPTSTACRRGLALRPDGQCPHRRSARPGRAADQKRRLPSLRRALGLPRPSLPSLPAKTKGKVERPIRYLLENFLYGREFLGDADLDAQAAA